MLDIDALLEAGFEKVLTDEEWQATANATPLVDFRLVRGNVLLSTERNTQEQDASGIQTTVRYPEIAVIQHLEYLNRRVTCASTDTELILLLSEEIVRTNDPHNRKR